MKLCKKTLEPLLKDEHKAQRKKFANCSRKKFRKERILFSDETMFDLDGIYNSENDRIWAVNREEANRRGGKTAAKVSTKSDGMVSRMVRGHCTPFLFEQGTSDHHRYIKKVLPIALGYGNSKFGNNWTFVSEVSILLQ